MTAYLGPVPHRGGAIGRFVPEAQALVYGNRRRILGRRGRRLMGAGDERTERSFAHGYNTGSMRRRHLSATPSS